MLRIAFFILLCLTSLILDAQPFQYRFHNYGNKEGLSSPSINAIAEDEFGFIWIGTEEGLFQFDAYEFKEFKRSNVEHPELYTNSITSLLPDQNGGLWVGTRDGLNYFDILRQKFTRHWEDQDLVYISKIISGNDGTIWVATDLGLFHYNPQTKDLKIYNHDPNDPKSISDNDLFDILLADDGDLWISTSNGGLNYYSKSSDSFKAYMHDPSNPNSISANHLRELAYLRNGNLLIGSYEDGLNILDLKSMEFKNYQHEASNAKSLSANSVYSILIDKQSNLWIGTWSNGLNLFDLEKSESRRFIYNPDDNYSIPQNSIVCMLQSSSGDIWLGTNGGGLSRLSLSEQEIIRFTHNTKDENSLLTDYVRSAYEDSNGDIWIGTGQYGLHKYNPKSEEFKVYLPSDGSRDAKARSTIWSISPGENDILWLGTSRGLAKFNKLSGEVKFYEPNENDPKSISTNNILNVFDDGRGSVWIGTWAGGLNRFNIEAEEFEIFLHDASDEKSLASNNIGDIFQDNEGRMWIASGGYLHLLNNDQKSFTRYEIPVYQIDQDSEGNLWLATDNGIVKFDTKENIFTDFIDQADGLSSESYLTINIDKNGIIWAGSSNGVDRLDVQNGIVTHLDEQDGLAGNNIGYRTSYYSDKLYIGGLEGLSVIDVLDYNPKRESRKVNFTNFLLFNKAVPIGDSSVLKESIFNTRQLTLTHKDYIFAFEFASLDFSRPGNIIYQYKLEGFDEEWLNTSAKDRKAVYTNVPHGDYKFIVRATDEELGWETASMASIDIKIIPPWWKTIWAQTLFYLSIILLGLLVFQIRISVVKRQKKELEEKVAQRNAEVLQQKEILEQQADQLKTANNQKNRILSIISHDLRAPLDNLSSINSMLDPNIITSEELSRFKGQVNMRIEELKPVMMNLLRWAKDQMEGEVFSPESFSIKQIIKEEIEILKVQAENKRIDLNIDINNRIEIFADINHTRIITRNLISNAIKFTPKGGTINLGSKYGENEIIFFVKDSGIGMSQDQISKLFKVRNHLSTEGTSGEKGVGLGLLLVKEFVEKNDGRLWVESEEGKGTTFYFSLKSLT